MMKRSIATPLQMLFAGLIAAPDAAAQCDWIGAGHGSPVAAKGDKDVLLAIAADPANVGADAASFRGWDTGYEPCAAGWDEQHSRQLLGRYFGYEEVMCDREGGRVVYVDLCGQRGWQVVDKGIGCDVSLFAPLGALQSLQLCGNAELHGCVGSLSSLTELRLLDLRYTAVHGAPVDLSGLTHLGEEYTVPGLLFPPDTTILGDRYSGRNGALYLADTRVAGPVAALRALPGLGSRWGEATPGAAAGGLRSGYSEFSWCSRFPDDTCSAAGLAMVADASSVAGTDECACCTGASGCRVEPSGSCAVSATCISEQNDTADQQLSPLVVLCILVLAVACLWARREQRPHGDGADLLTELVVDDPGPGLIDTQANPVGGLDIRDRSTDPNAKNCPICMEELNGTHVNTTPCGHDYHATCVRNWISRHEVPQCPLCRAPVTLAELVDHPQWSDPAINRIISRAVTVRIASVDDLRRFGMDRRDQHGRATWISEGMTVNTEELPGVSRGMKLVGFQKQPFPAHVTTWAQAKAEMGVPLP
eukprot:COSAG02_NODE_5480_length_4299_cov_2.231632_3_plen_533_part_01